MNSAREGAAAETTSSIAERVARLVRVPTVSAPESPEREAVFHAMRAELAACYPLVHEQLTIERVAPRSLQFRWEPEPGSEHDTGHGRRSRALATGPLVLMAHADVVPADEGDGWTHPPFDGTIVNGTVQGRGTLDDKGALACIFEAVESLIADGFRPLQPLIISLGGDEETLGTGGEDAARLIAERGETPWLVLDEGGAVVEAPLPFVTGEAAMIGVGEKGYTTLRLTARADPGHSSTPSGRSAPSRIARAIARLERQPFRPHVSPPVRDMLRQLSTVASPLGRGILRTLAALPAVTAPLFAALGGEPAALVRTTSAVTMLDGGTAPNVIAAEASAIVNLRIAPHESIASTLRRLRRVIGDRTIEIETLFVSEPTAMAPSTGPEFEALRQAVHASYPDAFTAPYLVMATTDARHFHRRWPAVYRFAPLRMTSAQRASIHGVNEYVTVDSLERGARFYRALISNVLGDRTATGHTAATTARAGTS